MNDLYWFGDEYEYVQNEARKDCERDWANEVGGCSVADWDDSEDAQYGEEYNGW
jgi:hypothetical protein